jgi:hypothetical protein
MCLEDQLAQMSQDPNSSYPAYLVLSEIQRRTLNEKNYASNARTTYYYSSRRSC